MAEKKSFLMYKSWAPLVEGMQDDQAGILFKAVFAYQMTGVEPDRDSAIFPMFNLFKSLFEQDQAAYEKTCETNRRISTERERNKTHRNEASRTATKRNHTKPDTDTDTDNDTDNDKDKDKDKDNENENDKGIITPPLPPRKTQAAMVENSDLAPEVKDKLLEWLKYKTERRESYKETGLRNLITVVGKHEREFGVDAVIGVITDSMSNGWQGIIWERIKRAPPKQGADVVNSWLKNRREAT